MRPHFDHEKLKVYQAAIAFVGWSTRLLSKVQTKAAVKDHLDRASTSIALNIAEGMASSQSRIDVVILISLVVQRSNPLLVLTYWSPKSSRTKQQQVQAKNNSCKLSRC